MKLASHSNVTGIEVLTLVDDVQTVMIIVWTLLKN